MDPYSRYTKTQIKSYSFRPEAVAPCFVSDVFSLKAAFDGELGATYEQPESDLVPDLEVWWLGTNPCRQVQLVGVVVGVMEFDNESSIRTVHTGKLAFSPTFVILILWMLQWTMAQGSSTACQLFANYPLYKRRRWSTALKDAKLCLPYHLRIIHSLPSTPLELWFVSLERSKP